MAYRSRGCVVLGTLLVSMLFATRAEAATLGTVTVTPSFETAGVIVQLSADSGNETVTVDVKGPGDADFRPAHPTTRFEPHAVATSLFQLAPDTDYQLRVTLADPDGVTGAASQTLTMHSRAEPSLPAPTRVRWVGPGGADAPSAGATKAAPYATPSYALAHASPGDEIRVLAGTYGATSASGVHGTEAAPIVLRADDPMAKPIIDGAGAGVSLGLDDTSYIVIDGFEVRGGGSDDSGEGVYLRASSHDTVRNCFIHDNGHDDVVISKGAEFSGGVLKAGYHLIEDNDIADLVHDTCAGASNDQCPGQTYYGVKLDNNPGAGVVIRRNRLRGHVDNTSPCGDEDVGRDLADGDPVLALVGTGPWTNHDLELYDNRLEDARDDGMELDGICVNARVWRNSVHNAQNAFSAAPVMPGPYFFVRNVASGTFLGAGFKMNTAGNSAVPSRHVFVYHNTFVWSTKGTLLDLWFAVEGDHNVPIHDFAFRNNVLSAPMGGACIDAYNHGTEQPTFDGDVWYTTDTSKLFTWWTGSSNASYDTFAAFQTGAMQEAKGAFNEPGLGADFIPTSDTAFVVDRAVALPGINDRYVGKGPDVGAFEFGAPVPGGEDGGVHPGGSDGGATDEAGAGPGGANGDAAASDDSGGCACALAAPSPRPLSYSAMGALFSSLLFVGTALQRRRSRRR